MSILLSQVLSLRFGATVQTVQPFRSVHPLFHPGEEQRSGLEHLEGTVAICQSLAPAAKPFQCFSSFIFPPFSFSV
jgi:hypothetical protein